MDAVLKNAGYEACSPGFLTRLKMGADWPRNAFAYTARTEKGLAAIFPMFSGGTLSSEKYRPSEYAVGFWKTGEVLGFRASDDIEFLPCTTNVKEAVALAERMERGESVDDVPNLSLIRAYWDGCYDEESEDIFVSAGDAAREWQATPEELEQYQNTAFMMHLATDRDSYSIKGTWTMFLPSWITRDSVDLPQASFEIGFKDHLELIGFWDRMEQDPAFSETIVEENKPLLDDVPMGVRNLITDTDRESRFWCEPVGFPDLISPNLVAQDDISQPAMATR